MTRDGEYRSKLLKLLADQARAELEVSNTYSKWIHEAPGPEEKNASSGDCAYRTIYPPRS
jgi:1,2-phenylacetyl-CoA epoxidase catalytic subunit